MSDSLEIKSVASFVALTTEQPRRFAIDSLYRGHRDTNWTLKPSIAREPRGLGHEQNRCILFMNAARTRHRPCPEPHDGAGWLFLMQHYGLHTRLLDWTESPLVALYFAVETDVETDSTVYVLDADRLNTIQNHGRGLVLPTHPAAIKLTAGAFQVNEPNDDVAAILPPEMDYRMLLQRSAFTLHGDATALEAHDRHSEFLNKINIANKHRQEIRRQLSVLGINRAHLFPDLQNLSLHLNQGTGGVGKV